MKTQISIIGCGWLGLPLAKALVHKGYPVNGSTTSNNKLQVLQQHHITPFLIHLDASGILGNTTQFLSGSKTVIINIPPGLRKNPDKNHVAEIGHLIDALEAHAIENVLYISSTSVFEDEYDFPVIKANTVPNATSKAAKQLIEIERKLMDSPSFNTTILRFGGLVGSQRHPSRFLAGKTNVADPEAPINLIHRSDCIGIILAIIEKGLWNLSLNAAYPEHPSKKVYYTNRCNEEGLPLPSFNTSEKSKGKLIDVSTLVQLLEYPFGTAP